LLGEHFSPLGVDASSAGEGLGEVHPITERTAKYATTRPMWQGYLGIQAFVNVLHSQLT
jgi:hypothetical protein